MHCSGYDNSPPDAANTFDGIVLRSSQKYQAVECRVLYNIILSYEFFHFAVNCTVVTILLIVVLNSPAELREDERWYPSVVSFNVLSFYTTMTVFVCCVAANVPKFVVFKPLFWSCEVRFATHRTNVSCELHCIERICDFKMFVRSFYQTQLIYKRTSHHVAPCTNFLASVKSSVRTHS